MLKIKNDWPQLINLFSIKINDWQSELFDRAGRIQMSCYYVGSDVQNKYCPSKSMDVNKLTVSHWYRVSRMASHHKWTFFSNSHFHELYIIYYKDTGLKLFKVVTKAKINLKSIE